LIPVDGFALYYSLHLNHPTARVKSLNLPLKMDEGIL